MDSIFFWLSKLLWLFISPDSLMLIALIVGVALLWLGYIRLSKTILTTAVLLMVLIALFPLGEWLLYPLESKYPSQPELPQQLDGIIVLGGAEDTKVSQSWGSVELGSAAERDIAFLEMARRYPEAKLLFTGGAGSMVNQQSKGADIARALFLGQGLDISRVIFERESRNTYENVIFSRKLAQPQPGEKWLLITTSWHMHRSRGIFCKDQWDVIPYPVDHETQRGNLLRVDLNFSGNLHNLLIGVKEWLGIVAYSVSGKMGKCS
jgi:uncharacterized SAM-binding protein YcdF (DUF218 family)